MPDLVYAFVEQMIRKQILVGNNFNKPELTFCPK